MNLLNQINNLPTQKLDFDASKCSGFLPRSNFLNCSFSPCQSEGFFSSRINEL